MKSYVGDTTIGGYERVHGTLNVCENSICKQCWAISNHREPKQTTRLSEDEACTNPCCSDFRIPKIKVIGCCGDFKAFLRNLNGTL